MAPFNMCPACQREYEDPLDRRFHAQPVACPECGPQIWLEPSGQIKEEALQSARKLLRAGQTVAIKGLGGFHLACDATNPEAVAKLRSRKGRLDKPFALMMRNIPAVERHCRLNQMSGRFLRAMNAPSFFWSGPPLLRFPPRCPYQHTLGVMLPYTPLHYLLLQPGFPDALVMTSGNISEEPIVKGNEEAREAPGQHCGCRFTARSRDPGPMRRSGGAGIQGGERERDPLSHPTQPRICTFSNSASMEHGADPGHWRRTQKHRLLDEGALCVSQANTSEIWRTTRRWSPSKRRLTISSTSSA